jgi:molecular chaperone DnaK (HSP70)
MESKEPEAIKTPKVRITIEFTRSGLVQVNKAAAGSSIMDVEHIRKASQLTKEQMKTAKQRLKWYDQRDKDKIKTDGAKNSFETMIYKMREWLREDDNEPYVEAEEREALLE